jgi:hypothetical protein
MISQFGLLPSQVLCKLPTFLDASLDLLGIGLELVVLAAHLDNDKFQFLLLIQELIFVELSPLFTDVDNLPNIVFSAFVATYLMPL